LVDEVDVDLRARHVGVEARRRGAAVVGGVVPGGEAVAVGGGRDDGFDAAAVVEDRFGEPGIGAAGGAGDVDQFARAVGLDHLGQQDAYALFGLIVKATVAGVPYPHADVPSPSHR
jgi:hypothetical protein